MAEQERFTILVHPLIAISIPASFLFTQVGFLSQWFPSWPLPALAGLGLTVLIGFGTVLVGNIFHKERLGFSARLRELIMLALLLYLVASLLSLINPASTSSPPHDVSTDEKVTALLSFFSFGLLKPSLFTIAVTSLGLLQWTFSVVLQEALRDRELLLAEIEGAQGLELQYRLRDMGTLPEDTLRGFTKIRTITRIFLYIILAEAAIHGYLYPGQSLASQLFMCPLFLLYAFLAALVSRYKREQYDAGAGIGPDRDSRIHQIRTILMLLVALFVLAFLGAGASSLLPIQWILAFFAWISSLMPKRTIPVPQTPEPLPELPDMEVLRRDLEALGSGDKGAPDLTFLWPILGIFSAIVAGLFILFFLVAPLKSRYFWERLRHIFSPKQLWRGLRNLLSYLKPRRAKPIDGLDLDPDNIKQVREQLEKLTAEKQDPRKRVQLGKMVDRYLRVLRWGETMRVPSRPSIAPGEYADTLCSRFPEIGEPLYRIAHIFEAALYGDRSISRDQWNQFNSAIETVLRYEGDR